MIPRPRRSRRWRLVRGAVSPAPRRLVRAARRRLGSWRGRWWPASTRGRMFLAVAALGTAAAVWIVFGTALLGVRRVAVTGASIAGGDAVRVAAAVRLGTPLARVDTAAVARRVARMAPVASVSVRRSWPNTIVITIVERVPVAAVAVADGFVVLDGAGVVFDTVASQPAATVLLRLSGPGPGDPATLAALRVVAVLTPQLRKELVAVVAHDVDHIRLNLTNDRAVIWGDAQQNETKARVATSLLGRPGTTIDVSAPDVVTVS